MNTSELALRYSSSRNWWITNMNARLRRSFTFVTKIQQERELRQEFNNQYRYLARLSISE